MMLMIQTMTMYMCIHAAVAVAVSTAFNWLSGFSFVQAFPSLLTTFHVFGVLYTISFINLTAGLFSLFLLPETKVSFFSCYACYTE